MKKPDADPNATIQLDISALEGLELEDPGVPASPPSGRPRVTPPPLPPGSHASHSPPSPTMAAPVAPSAAPPAGRPAPSKGRAVLYGGVFVVLLLAAVVGGVKAGFALRSAPAPTTSVAQAATPPTASATPAAAPANAIITLPTIDLQDPPDAK